MSSPERNELFGLFGDVISEDVQVNSCQVYHPAKEPDGMGGFDEVLGEGVTLDCDITLFRVGGETLLSVPPTEDIRIGDILQFPY